MGLTVKVTGIKHRNLRNDDGANSDGEESELEEVSD